MSASDRCDVLRTKTKRIAWPWLHSSPHCNASRRPQLDRLRLVADLTAALRQFIVSLAGRRRELDRVAFDLSPAEAGLATLIATGTPARN
jgi:hypothetical protein